MTAEPADVRRLSIALVRRYRDADPDAFWALLGELAEQDAAQTIASLAQLVSWALDDHPIDADEWLESVALIVPTAGNTP